MGMTPGQQDESDNKSLELYGVTNKQHYESLKARLLQKGSYNQEYIGTVESVQPKKETNIYENMEDLPYFEPSEMENMGVFSGDRFFKTFETDNLYIDESNKITSKMWFNDYKLYHSGLVTENKNEYSRMRVNTLHKLYSDYKQLKESGNVYKINARKQSILELGWNPEIEFNIENRIKVNRWKRTKLGSSILECIDMTNELDTVIQESEDVDNGRYPIFIVLTYTGTLWVS